MLEVSHISKTFNTGTVNEKRALSDLSLRLADGEFATIVGSNGAGKSTLFNAIAGVFYVDTGTITLDGETINPKKHNLAYIFQEYSTMEWLTVEENISYGLRIKHFPKDEIAKRTAEVMEIVGLTKYAKYYPNQLSASMLQRVVIARAFAVTPDLLLMDEPYGQLDLQLKYHLEDELINLWRRTGVTVIFITHNIEEAVYLSDRILVLTNKPTKIKCSIPNELPRPRKVSDPEFIKLRNEVTDLIKWW